jgi:hypothetical protein
VFELPSEGEINKVTTLQDAINKTFADMMVAAEFGAFVQRWIISQADPGDLKNAPNQIWWIPSGDGAGQASAVGQFTPTALGQYLDSMDKLANAIAIITRTPKHYFMTTGANVSGEALLAMESPLVQKVQARQRAFSAAWQDVAAFLLLLQGVTMDNYKIQVVWDRAESIQPYTEAQTRQLAINSGIPLATQLRREGWAQNEIDALMEDMAAARKATRSLGQEVLADLRMKQEQENPDA